MIQGDLTMRGRVMSENMGKTWEKVGKYGKIRENHGKIMGKGGKIWENTL